MRWLVAGAVLSMSFARPALAQWAPACTTGTLQDYLSLGSAGCSVGNVTFSNFGQVGWALVASYGSAGSSLSFPIPYSAFQVRPTTAPGGYVGFTILADFLNGSVACPCSPAGNLMGLSYYLTAGYSATARQGTKLNYFNTLHRGGPSVTGSGAANYASAVTQTALYAGDPNSNPSAPLVYHAVNYVNPPYQGVVYPPSPLPVPNGTSQVFSLNLATGWAVMGVGSAQVSGFEADFLVSTASTTPEPATLSLLALGLSGIGAAVGRRRRRDTRES